MKDNMTASGIHDSDFRSLELYRCSHEQNSWRLVTSHNWSVLFLLEVRRISWCRCIVSDFFRWWFIGVHWSTVDDPKTDSSRDKGRNIGKGDEHSTKKAQEDKHQNVDWQYLIVRVADWDIWVYIYIGQKWRLRERRFSNLPVIGWQQEPIVSTFPRTELAGPRVDFFIQRMDPYALIIDYGHVSINNQGRWQMPWM